MNKVDVTVAEMMEKEVNGLLDRVAVLGKTTATLTAREFDVINIRVPDIRYGYCKESEGELSCWNGKQSFTIQTREAAESWALVLLAWSRGVL